MIQYRIVKSQFADLSGAGAKEFGGRWNPRGLPALYTTEGVALAVCENLVHMGVKHLPKNRVLLRIEVPDEEVSTAYESFDFGKDDSVAEGESWLHSQDSLCIKVPSIIMPYSFNYVINTEHPGFQDVKLRDVIPFDFDRRFFT